jgi:hypothetical protein
MSRRILTGVLYLGFLVLLAEVAARTFLAIGFSVPFLRPGRAIYTFYPELESVEATALAVDDGVFDILMLGGSSLHPRWGHVQPMLATRLALQMDSEVRIHNLAVGSHSSRDSYLKYEHLRETPFDLVLFYHGINEARANNAPAEVFDLEYDHYAWYRQVNALRRHPEIAYLALPYATAIGWSLLGERLGWVAVIPPNTPRADSVAHGAQVKSSEAFRRNLTGILELAREKQEHIVVMTYAYYVPDDYSEEKFERKELDYMLHIFKIELWGAPDHVVAAIEAHNRVVRQVTPRYANAQLLDQEALIPKRGFYFYDVCHLSENGSARFVDNLLPLALKAGAENGRN